jgi:hypothetical protein
MRIRLTALLATLALLFLPLLPASAASTTKVLSTNFTVVNLSSATANVTAQYLKDNGTTWTTDPSLTSFTVPANGGQAIFRQYGITPLGVGRGSVVLTSDQPLGAIVQIRAIEPSSQVPTEGAYSGFQSGAGMFYVPLVARHLSTVSGTANSQVIIQDISTSTASVYVQLRGTGLPSGSPVTYTFGPVSLPAGTSYYYDVEEETNVPGGSDTSWYGSATIVATGGQVAVVSNFFTGANTMQTYRGLSQTATSWFVPLFTSRLANGLSSPISVQNVSSGTIPVGAVQLNCTASAGSPGPSTLSVSNSSAFDDLTSYYFNPVTDTTNFPAGWFGACNLNSGSSNVVSYIQLRFVGTDNADAYEAIPGGETNNVAFAPLVAQKLANGFATAVTIVNLGGSSANVTLDYTPNTACSGCSPYSWSTSIPAGQNLIQNQRLGGDMNGDSIRDLPDGWYGSLKVTCTNGQPIDGFVQLTNVLTATGDTYQAHNMITTSSP